MEVRAASLGLQVLPLIAVLVCSVTCTMAMTLVLASLSGGDKRLACRAAAVLTGVLSLAVTVAEVTLSDRLPNLSIFASALHATAGNETVSELLGFIFLVLALAVGSRSVALHHL